MTSAEGALPALNDAPRRRSGLTPRQQEVFALLCEGLSNKHICRLLDIAYPTVKTHVSAILRAVGASNRVEAALSRRELDRVSNVIVYDRQDELADWGR